MRKEKTLGENLEKIPPQNLEAERSVLGAMLLEKETIPRVVQIISDSNYFYLSTHKLIYEAILSLFESNKPVDLITLREKFHKQGKLDKIGGSSYIADLVNCVITTANVDYYAQIVKEKYILRNLLKVANEISYLSYNDSFDLDVILDKSQSLIFNVIQQTSQTSYVHIKEILAKTFEHIEALYEKKEQITGIPTGFDELNRLTSGFQPSDLIVIAGRPAMGKTAFALNIAQHAAAQARVSLLIFSLESAKEQLVERMLCSEAKVDSQKLRTGYLSEDDWNRLMEAAGTLAEVSLYIDDTPNISIQELRAKARQLKTEQDIKMIIVDYLQLMS